MINEIADAMKHAKIYEELKEIFHYHPSKERYDYLIQAKEELHRFLLLAKNEEVASMLKLGEKKIEHELSLYQRKVIEETDGGFLTTCRLMTENEMNHYEDYLLEMIQWQYKVQEKKFPQKETHWLEERWQNDAMDTLYMAEALLYERTSQKNTPS